MYLTKSLILVVLILKKITTSIFEKKFISIVLIIEKLKTLILKKKCRESIRKNYHVTKT